MHITFTILTGQLQLLFINTIMNALYNTDQITLIAMVTIDQVMNVTTEDNKIQLSDTIQTVELLPIAGQIHVLHLME